MSMIGTRLSSMGLVLPEVFAAPAGMEIHFDLVKVVGDVAHVSGHGPMDGARPLMQGKVGRELSLEQGKEAARMTGLSVLASLQAGLGDLDRVRGRIKSARIREHGARLRADACRDRRIHQSDPRTLG